VSNSLVTLFQGRIYDRGCLGCSPGHGPITRGAGFQPQPSSFASRYGATLVQRPAAAVPRTSRRGDARAVDAARRAVRVCARDCATPPLPRRKSSGLLAPRPPGATARVFWPPPRPPGLTAGPLLAWLLLPHARRGRAGRPDSRRPSAQAASRRAER
jgi:hypothetical protein